ncbi:MAG: hypothetical protein EA380_09230 [Phycisphaeraceae bacterium]|nr:MAG: hypothetical protein EA380_09230 [Phycisphaeraceae bacterium]
MKVNQLKTAFLTIGAICMLSLSACQTAPKTAEGRENIRSEAAAAVARAKQTDSTLTRVLNDAAGYAVFPSVGKGAVGVGGAYGKGVLYERNRVVGYCDLTQGTIGLQLGGQSYTQIIAFETNEAVRNFKAGNLRFAAQATAVALRSGAGANANYTDGVAVFTMDEAGLMFEASIGGQQFTYQDR